MNASLVPSRSVRTRLGALRCAIDNLNGGDVDWIPYPVTTTERSQPSTSVLAVVDGAVDTATTQRENFKGRPRVPL
jgi:hypothetical protein